MLLTEGDSPAWSADGAKLAYGCTCAERVERLHGKRERFPVNVLDNADVNPQDDPYWSPAGRRSSRSSVSMCDTERCVLLRYRIWRIDAADGGDPIRLALAPAIRAGAASKDG